MSVSFHGTTPLRTSGLSDERRAPRRASATFPTILVQPYSDAWPSLTRVAKVEGTKIPKIMSVHAIFLAEATPSSLVSRAGSARFYSSACPLTAARRLVDTQVFSTILYHYQTFTLAPLDNGPHPVFPWLVQPWALTHRLLFPSFASELNPISFNLSLNCYSMAVLVPFPYTKIPFT
jgi:hypothetical protein